MLSLEELTGIARLARIEVREAEVGELREQLNGILALIDQMLAVDTRGVDPMSHPQSVMQRLREDSVTEGNERERFQSVAPRVEDGLYLVPKVIE